MKFVFLKQSLIFILGAYYYDVLRYVIAHKKFPQTQDPITFNDKLARRKLLYSKDPHYIHLTNKLLVREFVSERISPQFLTKLYIATDDVESICLDQLPDSFVMKAVHGSGPQFITFVKDRRAWTNEQLRMQADKLLQQTYGNLTNELWYAQMKPYILIEELLSDQQFEVPLDYKFFVFAGRVEYIQVDYARFSKHTRTFYDRDWQVQPFTFKYPQGSTSPRPKQLTEMITIAERLAQGFDFVRIDLYCVNETRIVFGEITLAPEAGWGKFEPKIWDYRLGQMWATDDGI